MNKIIRSCLGEYGKWRRYLIKWLLGRKVKAREEKYKESMNKEVFNELYHGFETAYINGAVASNVFYKPQFVSNNYREGKKVLSYIEDELLTCDHFQISVAFITMGGVTPLLQTLKELEKRGIAGEILTTNYLNFSEPEALYKLHSLKNIILKMYDVEKGNDAFHTKGYIFKKEEIYHIMIGSSNMTSAALTCNKEWNAKLVSTDRGEIVKEVLEEFWQLWKSDCTLEYDDKAPDYGFPEWHAPCGEFCAMAEGKCDITASSELQDSDASGDAGADGYSYPGRRYEPDHLNSLYGREYAWAEGVDGNGIGESIGIISSCSYQYQREWYEEGDVSFLEGYVSDEFSPNLYAKDTPDIYDGYMRYTEICVVNGYAKNQKTWEENGRVKRLLMYVEDKPFAYLELEDTIKPQYFTLPVDAVKAADKVEIHFRFVIEDVYPGTKYEDTCLTGLVVEYMGRRGH